MRFCKYCGKQIFGDEAICPDCQERMILTSDVNIYTKGVRKEQIRDLVVGVVFAIIVLLVVVFSIGKTNKCEVSGCNNKTVRESNYCYSHKCVLSACTNKRYSYSNYCEAHYSLYDDNAESRSNTVYSWELGISGVSVFSNSSYTIAEGKFTNNSDTTVKFVKIKGAFQDRNGKVVDTDWTYAVGSEGLAPSESCKWRMSVLKDSSITKCDVTVIDYDT